MDIRFIYYEVSKIRIGDVAPWLRVLADHTLGLPSSEFSSYWTKVVNTYFKAPQSPLFEVN